MFELSKFHTMAAGIMIWDNFQVDRSTESVGSNLLMKNNNNKIEEVNKGADEREEESEGGWDEEWENDEGEDIEEIIRNNKEDKSWMKPNLRSEGRRMTKRRKRGAKHRRGKKGWARNLKKQMKRQAKQKKRGQLTEKTKSKHVGEITSNTQGELGSLTRHVVHSDVCGGEVAILT